MNRFILAALMLACVCSPALVAGQPDPFGTALGALGFFTMAVAFVSSVAFVISCLGIPLLGLAQHMGNTFAIVGAVAMGGAAMTCIRHWPTSSPPRRQSARSRSQLRRCHWGDWFVAALQPVSAVLVPLAVAAVTVGIAKYARWRPRSPPRIGSSPQSEPGPPFPGLNSMTGDGR